MTQTTIDADALAPTAESSIKYIPLGDGSSSIDKELFTHEAEYFIHTKDINLNTQIITVLDNFAIGEGTDLADDTNAPETQIFAEGISINGKFKANKLLLSANHITASNESALDVSGKPIDPYNEPEASKDGKAGDHGNQAGSIKLYTEVIPSDVNDKTALPQLLATGGNGQDGQNATLGAGGDGGKGGNGGSISVFIPISYLSAIESVDSVLKNLDDLNKINLLIDILTPFDQTLLLSNGTTLSQSLASLKDEGNKLFPDKTNPKTPVPHDQALPIIVAINKIISVIKNSFVNQSDLLKTELLPSLHTGKGEAGIGGSGPKGDGKTGGNGPDPSDGTSQFNLYPNNADLPLDFILESINLTECRMLLSKAKMRYLQSDSVSNIEALKDTALLFQRLIFRLGFVPKWIDPNGKVKNTRLSPYVQIYNEAVSYYSNFSQGLDYYGHGVNTVPLLDLKTYKEELSGLLNSFQKIEAAYVDYFTSLQAQTQTRDQLLANKAYLNGSIGQAQSNLNYLSSLLDNIGGSIAHYDDPIEQKKQHLEMIIDNLKSDINNYYNFSFADGFGLFKDLVGALTSVAFMPESGFMMGIQGASSVGDIINTLGIKPTATINTDSGQTINKGYLVNQIVYVKDSVDGLSEGYQALDNGQLQPDDPGAAKLLMAESQMEKIMNDFKTILPDDIDALRKAFQDYISLITERNTAILKYNTIVNLIGAEISQKESATDMLRTLNDQSFASMDPGLPDLVQMASRIYVQTRDQIMNTYYVAAKALQFWSLSNTNILAQILNINSTGTQPTSLDFNFISTQLDVAWIHALESFKTNPSRFPTNDLTEDGAIIAFTDDATLSTFRNYYGVTVQVPLVRKTTSGKAPSQLDPLWKNQLLIGLANIRLLNVYVWLDGAKIIENGKEIDDLLNIKITHGGVSLFASSQDSPFRFTHESIVKTFKYFTQSRDPNNPHRLRNDLIANFGDLFKDDPTHGENFALISPFTSWTIELLNVEGSQSEVGLISALTKKLVKEGSIIKYNDQTQSISAVSTENGVSIVTIKLLGIVVQVFTVKAGKVFDKAGRDVNEPTILIPNSDRYIDLSGLTAIRLEFTGTGYSFDNQTT